VLELLILDLEQNGVEINSAGQVYAYEAKDSKKIAQFSGWEKMTLFYI
jgi:hypothetical protein